MFDDPQPSLEEMANRSERVLLFGAGATDVVNGLPIANHLQRLGFDEEAIHFGALACQWWESTEADPDFYPNSALKNVDRIDDRSALIRSDSLVVRKGTEYTPPEVIFPDEFGYSAVVFDGTDGAEGLRDTIQNYTDKQEIDLIINVDCGSDSLFDGEVGNVETPLHDFMTMVALNAVSCPTIHALSGYGLDGEMPMDALQETVVDLMRQSAYLGAHGITQPDIQDLQRANELVDDPINSLVIPAATGDHAPREVFGRHIEITPLAAIILLFDLEVVVNNGPAQSLVDTTSILEAEQRLLEADIVPETRL